MALNPDINALLLERNSLAYTKAKPITWSAVISGAMIAFGLTFLFHLLTLGIGLAIFSTNEQGMKELAFNGYIWTLAGSIIILFIAGWKTGKLIRIYPVQALHVQQEMVAGNPSTEPTLASEKTYTHSYCECSHGMTHGFLAWVLYLMISLVFMIFIAQAGSVAFLKSSFLNIPMGFTQTINQGLPQMNQSVGQSSATSLNPNRQAPNQFTQEAQKQNARPVSTKDIQKTGAEVIALFLLFVLGAAACGIGSYLGAICHKRCVAKKLNRAANTI